MYAGSSFDVWISAMRMSVVLGIYHRGGTITWNLTLRYDPSMPPKLNCSGVSLLVYLPLVWVHTLVPGIFITLFELLPVSWHIIDCIYFTSREIENQWIFSCWRVYAESIQLNLHNIWARFGEGKFKSLIQTFDRKSWYQSDVFLIIIPHVSYYPDFHYGITTDFP